MYQPKRASNVRRSSGRRSERPQLLAIHHRSRAKCTTTAAAVPSCTTAVKAAPGSGQPIMAGTIRRCAVDEIGRNSVSPWTIP